MYDLMGNLIVYQIVVSFKGGFVIFLVIGGFCKYFLNFNRKLLDDP